MLSDVFTASKIDSAYFAYLVNHKPLKIHRLTYILKEQIDPLRYLNQAQLYPKVFWKIKNRSTTLLGLGSAYAVDNLPLFQEPIHKDSPPFFGGQFFQKAPSWHGVPAPTFFIPTILITCQEHSSPVLYYHYLDTEESTSLGVLLEPSDTPLPIYNPSDGCRIDNPSFENWKTLVQTALHAFDTSPLEKVVLARASHCFYTHSLNPWSIVQHLLDQARSCSVFGYIPSSKTHAFIGASPEHLYRREEGMLYTEALAGTKPKGFSAEEELKHRHALLHGDKEQREFNYVQTFLKNALSELCSEYFQDRSISVINTSSLQHCYSGFKGLLHPWVQDHTLLEVLHPTPAIGGFPRALALDFIAQHEPFIRGYYAAPIGWIAPHSSEFIVGIRSALIYENTMTLFAGAGLVKGSNALQEWEELESKISSFIPSCR